MSMYLTQAFMDFREARDFPVPAGNRGLRDLYDWHQLVWSAFPDRDGEKRDFLTRIDARERERRYRLLILSPRFPTRPNDWSEEPEAWQTREVPASFFEHGRYRFQLRVNPTKRDSTTRKRVALKTDAELHAWLRRKGDQHGFDPDMDTVRSMRESFARFRIRTRNLRGCHHSVNFDGELTIADRDAFRQVCIKGVGSAKAFAFGLLAIVPLRT